MNKRLTAGLLAALIVTPLAAGAEDIRDVVEANHAAWQAALNQRNVDGLLQTYSADAVLMPPTDDTLAGHGAIGAYLAQLAASGVEHNGIDIYDLQRAGDTVYAAGVWSATVPGSDGPQLIGGNMVSVLERQADGSWKTRLQTWN